MFERASVSEWACERETSAVPPAGRQVAAPVEEGGGGGSAVLEALAGGVHGEHDVQVPHDLLGEPAVQLLGGVQHQPLALGALLALRHQRRKLVTLKQTWHLDGGGGGGGGGGERCWTVMIW